MVVAFSLTAFAMDPFGVHTQTHTPMVGSRKCIGFYRVSGDSADEEKHC